MTLYNVIKCRCFVQTRHDTICNTLASLIILQLTCQGAFIASSHVRDYLSMEDSWYQCFTKREKRFILHSLWQFHVGLIHLTLPFVFALNRSLYHPFLPP